VARAVIRKYLSSCLRRVLAQRSDGADLSKELNWDGMSLSCRALAPNAAPIATRNRNRLARW
jgi:hypothetical protein